MENHEHGAGGGGVKVGVVAKSEWTPARVRRLRKGRGLSPAQFGKLFRDKEELPNGYTRNYISMLERGKVPLTERFEKNLERVRAQLRAQPIVRARETHAVEVEIVCESALPQRVHIVGKIKQCARRRCSVCKKNRTRFFVPRMIHQKQHVLSKRQLKDWREANRRRKRNEKRRERERRKRGG